MDDKMIAKEALAINFGVLRLCGIWIAGIRNSTLRFLYNLYGSAMSMMSMAYFSTEIIYMCKVWGDIEAISEISFLLLTHIGTAVKLINFFIRRKRIEILFKDSYQEIFLPKNIKHRTLLKSTMRRANRDNIIFLLMCFSTVIAWGIVPLVEKNNVLRLPLKTWLPFSTDASPIFQIIYTYQIFSVTMNACMTAMLDTFASILMALAGAQLDILRYDLSNLEYKYNDNDDKNFTFEYIIKENIELISNVAMMNNKVKRKLNFGIGAKKFLSDQDDILHKRIVGCIQHHGAIIRFANEIQDVFGIEILVQFAVSSTILCLTCFELTLISPTSLKFLSMLLYQGCMLCQIYCYSWHGNEIILKTSDLMTAAFQCQWTTCSRKFKSTLRIVMCRMQRPMRLMVGGLFCLSLETFSMILRTAYSFYAVLQRVHSRVTEKTEF